MKRERAINERKTRKLWQSLPERYAIDVICDNFPHRGLRFRNVWVSLFRHDAIEGIEKLTIPSTSNAYIHSQIEETFNRVEMRAILAYLLKHYKSKEVKVVIQRATPPKNNCMGLGAIAVGGLCDFYMFSEERGYDLPFEVWGYFDVRNSEVVKE